MDQIYEFLSFPLYYVFVFLCSLLVLVLSYHFATPFSWFDLKKPSPSIDFSSQKMAKAIRWIWNRVKLQFKYTIPNSQDDQDLASASFPSVATVPVASTLSSSSAIEWKYDVFLSFRGADTRMSITYELYDQLQHKRGVKTFMDDQDLEVGDPISPTLLKAIEESRFAIVVLSPNYASSTWCLEELKKICECMKDNNRVLPLFYNVELSDARYQKSSFGEAFNKHKRFGRHTAEKLQQWRDALKRLASFSGWHTNNFKTDRELVDSIVEFVCSKVHPIEMEFTMATGDFQPFAATRKAMIGVLQALQDDKVTALGVYGMGGVGKTAMVKHVGAEACKMRIFDHVIVVVVSQSPHLSKMQQTFAEQLSFNFQENLTESGRASRLYKEIMRKNNILIILDDIWKFIDLSRIGIPSYDELKKCNAKVLLTTRILHVCNSMSTEASIPLSILSDEDSWTLFATKARRSFESIEFNDVARKVAKECKGLPIALIAVARALGDKDLVEWEKAAQRLEKSQSATLDDEQDAYECIKFSYDYLKDEDSKACFLLCCLFPEDYEIKIEELFRYAIGIGLFQDSETMYEARGTAESVVKYLKDSSLLLDSGDEESVTMHDVIRDAAMNIAKYVDGHGFLVRARRVNKLISGRRSEDWPRLLSEGYSAISLMNNPFSKLPLRLVCPKLRILLLNNNRYLEKIPDTFFQCLKELRVLDLSWTYISLLPQSIGLLTNLRALYLDHCTKITDISMVGKLTKLEILSTQRIELEELSSEIGDLTNLRALDNSAGQIARIPSKLISRLQNLEELSLEYEFLDWESFNEVISLPKLRVLKASLTTDKCIPKNVELNPNWVRFNISISQIGLGDPPMYCDTVNYSNTNRISNLQNWFVNAVNQAEGLKWLNGPGFWQAIHIFREHRYGRLHGLGHLAVSGSDKLMNSVTWVPGKPMLTNLEMLVLIDINFKDLCVEELAPGPLFNLKHLEVSNCYECGNVLLPSTLLQKLANLEVLDCRSMEEIEYVFQYKVMLEPKESKLRNIILSDLVAVRSICGGPAPPAIFQNLESLYIKHCILEGSLFTCDVAQCLFQLKSLELEDCLRLEKIVEEPDKSIILSKLEILRLGHLPKLNYDSATMIFKCPSLKELSVWECPKFSVSRSDFHSRNQIQYISSWKENDRRASRGGRVIGRGERVK